MTSCWKYFDHSLNNCEGLTQWGFVTLGTTLAYITSNLDHLRNCLEANQCIDGNRWNHKNLHPLHNLPQTCGGSKYVYMVFIHPTDNFPSHTMKIFRINERWSDKYDAHKSKINKRYPEQRTWRVFYINKTKTPKSNTW